MKVVKSVVMIIIVVLIVSGTMATAAPLKLGITWIGESLMVNEVVKAFREKITELVPEVEIEVQKVPEDDNYEALGRVIARFEQEKDGMIVPRSQELQWFRTHPPTIPTFFAVVTYPGELGVVKNLEAPEGNITGVLLYIPTEQQFEIFQALLPNLKSVLLLLQEGHPVTQFDRMETQAVCKRLGLTYYESVCTTQAEIIAAVEAYRDKVSAVIIGSNNLADSNTEQIVTAAGATPVLAYGARPVGKGALGGFAVDITVIGRLLAESVVEVLVKGKAINEVPIKTDPNPTFFVNIKTAERLGIKIPYNILKAATIVE